ncbi:hypothetical protein G6O67_002095 [Ophiocordyceps sinensis]|uniref:Uncharacterized protein n=1 Tax=Ophiocordyceps sinensis TaxID=72228 RepID=A0A8H4V6V4_9HYPO|nr:hypothetical protein G6O67_002095 [Ophiocordyceps sinensis]
MNRHRRAPSHRFASCRHDEPRRVCASALALILSICTCRDQRQHVVELVAYPSPGLHGRGTTFLPVNSDEFPIFGMRELGLAGVTRPIQATSSPMPNDEC